MHAVDPLYSRWLWLGAAAVAGGALATRLGLPVAWLLGAMAGSLALVLVRGEPQPFPPQVALLANTVLGTSSGLLFDRGTALLMARSAGAVAAVVAATLVLSAGMGWALARWGRLDPTTAYLGAVPGAASGMVALSHELGADIRVVALLQYLRLIMVLILVPLALPYLVPAAAGAGGAAAIAAPAAAGWQGLAVTVGCMVGGALAGRLLRLPSPYFLGPMLAAALGLWTGWWHGTAPDWLFALALAVTGTAVGARFERRLLRRLARVVAVEAVLVVGLIAACGAVGALFHLVTGVSLATALLGTAPGAMETMVAAAMEQGGDAPLVVAMHTLRWLAVVLLAPSLVPFLVRRAGSLPSRAAD